MRSPTVEADDDQQEQGRAPAEGLPPAELRDDREADEARVARIVAEYVDELNQGLEPDQRQYLERCPELREAVEEGLNASI